MFADTFKQWSVVRLFMAMALHYPAVTLAANGDQRRDGWCGAEGSAPPAPLQVPRRDSRTKLCNWAKL
jgi:hypothetical protein